MSRALTNPSQVALSAFPVTALLFPLLGCAEAEVSSLGGGLLPGHNLRVSVLVWLAPVYGARDRLLNHMSHVKDDGPRTISSSSISFVIVMEAVPKTDNKR